MSSIYNDLPLKKNEFRILDLSPGTGDQPLECQLRKVALDGEANTKASYKAVSYVWGDVSDLKPLLLNGATHTVTASLDAALRAFRDTREMLTFWMDMLCINQADTAEKNTQVPMMTRIYQQAEQVVVWLGPSTPFIEAAVAFHEKDKKKNTFWQAPARWFVRQVAVSLLNDEQRGMAWYCVFFGLTQLLSLDYWNRMWTFQEFLVSKSPPLCHCGELVFHLPTLEDMTQTASMAIRATSTPQQEGSGSSGPRLKNLLLLLYPGHMATEEDKDAFYAAHSAIRQTDALISQGAPNAQYIQVGKKTLPSFELSDNTMIAALGMKALGKFDQGPRLLSLLETTRNGQSSEPRDRFFVLYGMVSAALEVCPVDYTRSMRDIAIDVVNYILNHDDGGATMWTDFDLRKDHLQTRRSTNSPADDSSCGSYGDEPYPSWVPDFRSGNKYYRKLLPDTTPYLYHPGYAWSAKIAADRQTLHLWGRLLGPCRVVCQFPASVEGIMKVLLWLIREHIPDLSADAALRLVRDPESVQTQLARILFAYAPLHDAGGALGPVPQSPEILQTVKASLDSGAQGEGRSWEAAVVCFRRMFNRCLIVTAQHGILGLGASEIMDGDSVIVPLRIDAALALRPENPLRSAGSSSLHYYQMVGTVVLDGMCYGDGYDEGITQDVAQYGIEEFLIH